MLYIHVCFNKQLTELFISLQNPDQAFSVFIWTKVCLQIVNDNALCPGYILKCFGDVLSDNTSPIYIESAIQQTFFELNFLWLQNF